jgi:6-pyruvoyltetrahydropterin/6-carboxytetrahydropterin synthase
MDFSASFRDGSGATTGHNYELEVTVSGRIDPATGMVVDLKDLKELMEREIEARFDHRSLTDDTPYFRDKPATPETFAALIFSLLDTALGDGSLHSVRLSPTRELTIEVTR